MHECDEATDSAHFFLWELLRRARRSAAGRQVVRTGGMPVARSLRMSTNKLSRTGQQMQNVIERNRELRLQSARATSRFLRAMNGLHRTHAQTARELDAMRAMLAPDRQE